MSYDVAILQEDESGQIVQDMASSHNNGYKITGKTKLMQRFIIELMTEKGSLIYKPDRGCNFVTLLRTGTTGTWDIIAAFATALLDVISNLQAEDSDFETTDTTEMISSADIVSIGLSPGTVSLKVRIVSQAGESFNTIIPLSFTNL